MHIPFSFCMLSKKCELFVWMFCMHSILNFICFYFALKVSLTLGDLDCRLKWILSFFQWHLQFLLQCLVFAYLLMYTSIVAKNICFEIYIEQTHFIPWNTISNLIVLFIVGIYCIRIILQPFQKTVFGSLIKTRFNWIYLHYTLSRTNLLKIHRLKRNIILTVPFH